MIYICTFAPKKKKGRLTCSRYNLHWQRDAGGILFVYCLFSQSYSAYQLQSCVVVVVPVHGEKHHSWQSLSTSLCLIHQRDAIDFCSYFLRSS